MKDISEKDLGWIGGIMDGEGHIGVARSKKNGRRNYNYGATVLVTNTQISMLNRLLILTNIGAIFPKNNYNPAKHKQGWIWNLKADEQRAFLPIILPYLFIKREQAELVIEFLDLPCGTGRHQNPDEEALMMRSIIFSELAELNQTGPQFT